MQVMVLVQVGREGHHTVLEVTGQQQVAARALVVLLGEDSQIARTVLGLVLLRAFVVLNWVAWAWAGPGRAGRA